MSFGEAVSSGFSNYANFSGRTPRSGYWWWVLFTIIVSVVASVVDNVAGLNYENQNAGWVSTIAGLALLIPSISVLFRRLHDIGRSGWWWLLGLICCIGQIILFVFALQDSQPGDNQYGPNPKGLAA
ncbi:MAG: DUF805 domain-containing protein [Candidatus Nanopelagicales bacterium]